MQPAELNAIRSPSPSAVLPTPVREAIERLATEGHAAIVRRALATAEIVGGLTDDEDIVKGAALLPLLEISAVSQDTATTVFGETATRIAAELVRVGSLGLSGT